MKSFYRWMSDHAFLAFFLPTFVWAAELIWLHFAVQLPLGSVIVALLLMGFVFALCPQVCKTRLLLLASKEMVERCNPQPLREEIERQLRKNRNEMREQLLLIDLSAALINQGDHAAAHEILKKINIDRFSGILPFQKFVYYNNLADACTNLEYFDLADAWTQKALQNHENIKNKKQLKVTHFSVQALKCEALYRKREYTMALQACSVLTFENLLQRVDTAFFTAKCLLALDRYEEAREALGFVIANGNKCGTVQKAQKLLERLPTKKG